MWCEDKQRLHRELFSRGGSHIHKGKDRLMEDILPVRKMECGKGMGPGTRPNIKGEKDKPLLLTEPREGALEGVRNFLTG